MVIYCTLRKHVSRVLTVRTAALIFVRNSLYVLTKNLGDCSISLDFVMQLARFLV